MSRIFTNTRCYVPRPLKCICILLILLSSATVIGVQIKQCLEEIRKGTRGQVGGTDNHGRPLSNIADATAITYNLCIRACGAGPEPFDWSVFSQQVSSWLLPWLALISQLPFGSNDKLDNLLSMLLTVESLALTVLNGRWIARHFSYTYPNTRLAIRVLSSLQQFPLKIITNDSLLPPLVVLPENDGWWKELVVWLDFTHTWSISAVFTMIIFTVADSLTCATNITTTSINTNGQAVSSLWIWLLFIVIILAISGASRDTTHVYQAVKRANDIVAHVATPSDGPVLAKPQPKQYTIFLTGVGDLSGQDKMRTVPTYDYARLSRWVQAMEGVEMSGVFRAASRSAASFG